jgi:cold shock CspA family protein
MKGHVKWSNPKKPFCYLTLDDGRDVFLHRDDFEGEWPPTYYQTLKFELLKTGHKTCPLRAKHAALIGGAK